MYPILAYVQATNPRATTDDKLLRLFDGLPTHLKKHFVRYKLSTVDEFTERLKDVRREQLYDQKTLIQQVASGLAPTSASILSVMTASAPNLTQGSDRATLQALLALNQSTANSTAMANLSGAFGNSSQLNQQSLASAVRSHLVPDYANLPVSSATVEMRKLITEVGRNNDLQRLQKQVDQLTAELRSHALDRGAQPETSDS